MNSDPRLFVDSENQEPLPPLFKGRIRKFYPGQMVRNTNNGRRYGVYTEERPFKKTGLRRYVFRYENSPTGGTFVYLATRKGQRNGGFNSRPNQTTVGITWIGSGINVASTFSLSAIDNNQNPVYASSENSILRYDVSETRWEWETRPALSAAYSLNAFSSTTSNTLRNSGATNEVSWTYIENPYTTATPQLPVIATITPLEWYNNNSVENLNKWPIKNNDADYNHVDPATILPWQKKDANGATIIPDRRIEGLTDDFLHRCFKGVRLKPYDTVFVEVLWKFRMNRSDFSSSTPHPPTYRTSTWGYWDRIHDHEWWSPKPFRAHVQKGRVYRIGILEGDTGPGGYDKVLWAQRTRIITTKRLRGGRTVLE